MNQKAPQAIQLSREVVTKIEEWLLAARAHYAEIESDLAEAASHGDLRENREFEIAKQNKELQQHKIAQLEKVLNNCEVCETEADKKYNKVGLMTFVQLMELTTNISEGVYIVIDALGDAGQVDFDGKQLTPDRVSNECHFGKTLMNKPVDSIITYGDKKYRIMSISSIDYSTFFDV